MKKLDKTKFLEILAQSRVVARACRESDPPISRMALYKAMRKDIDFHDKVEAILHTIAPKPLGVPLKRVDDESYILPVAEVVSVPVVPIAVPEIEPTPADPALTLRAPTTAYCERCKRHYTIPNDNSYSLICMGCNHTYIISKREWHKIELPPRPFEGVLNGP